MRLWHKCETRDKTVTDIQNKGWCLNEKSGGKICRKYCAVCRNKNNHITLTFKRNRVVVKSNEKAFVIEDGLLTEEQLIAEMAVIINANN